MKKGKYFLMSTDNAIVQAIKFFLNTRKYPLRGYILGVLTHTTALDRLWGGDEILTMWF